jgi:hypothetical protein
VVGGGNGGAQRAL